MGGKQTLDSASLNRNRPGRSDAAGPFSWPDERSARFANAKADVPVADGAFDLAGFVDRDFIGRAGEAVEAAKVRRSLLIDALRIVTDGGRIVSAHGLDRAILDRCKAERDG